MSRKSSIKENIEIDDSDTIYANLKKTIKDGAKDVNWKRHKRGNTIRSEFQKNAK
jgi:hypothetical protein